MEYEKKLMIIDEFCKYVGIGKTKTRELLFNLCCKYVVRIGRRVYVHKELFDEELKKCKIPINYVNKIVVCNIIRSSQNNTSYCVIIVPQS